MTNIDTQNRESFLNNLTEKLGIERQNVAEHPFYPINDLPATTLQDKSSKELLEIAKKRVEKINTNLVETTKAQLKDTIDQLTKELGQGKILLPIDERFAEYGLEQFSKEHRLESADDQLMFWEKGAEQRETNIANAERANIAIAFAEFLLAESGSIVVETNAGQGRSLHFLPQHYISIIPMSKIVPRSTQAAAYYAKKQEKGEKVGSAIHFISGPSNSGDIEMQLVVGLHGPLAVYYIVVTDM
ncbi:LutC/YkgG family protein [Candidatus Enterococcus ikei]|uniref:Lactate utilization protein C n=1 Tax=Candidatus Enterococcus ikei TaxID=2815326 RepID=A0ABS3GY99_9ENTE|nr:lactate utilization protein C [Enterococcus sp. DIV0869a]MBO0440235.1 lactate utilization protein C [Enterococcus sp. DIV0869a]